MLLYIVLEVAALYIYSVSGSCRKLLMNLRMLLGQNSRFLRTLMSRYWFLPYRRYVQWTTHMLGPSNTSFYKLLLVVQVHEYLRTGWHWCFQHGDWLAKELKNSIRMFIDAGFTRVCELYNTEFTCLCQPLYIVLKLYANKSFLSFSFFFF